MILQSNMDNKTINLELVEPTDKPPTRSKRGAASRLLWKIEKAYSLGIPKKKLALGESQTEEEHAYGRKYTMFWRNGRSFRT